MYKKLILLSFSVLVSLQLWAQESTEKQIHTLVDNWHKAAAEAKLDTYFGLMSERSVFIGTDSWERWNRQEFFEFAKPYFDRGKAWSFTAFDRQVFISADGKAAWFSELLNTQMGICRGSGMLSLINGSWKIEQYHLSVTLPNEELPNFMKLVEGKQRTSK